MKNSQRQQEIRYIHHLFYVEKKKVIDIAKQLSISNGKVSGIIQKHPDYKKEKERRKAESRERRRKAKAEYSRAAREKKSEEDKYLYDVMVRKQALNAISMSNSGRVNNRYLSGMTPYVYDGKKHMVFDEEVFGSRPSDMPQRICIIVGN